MTEKDELYLEHRRGESGLRVQGTFIPFMKEGQDLDVIVCIPESWKEKGAVVPGSEIGQCDTCGQNILIAPSTREVMKEHPGLPTRCIYCLKKELEEKGNEGR